MEYKVLYASEFLQNERDINIHEKTIDHYPLHTHDFVEMAFILSGRGTHIVNGERYKISKGDLFLLNEKVFHEFQSDNNEPLTVYNCIFKPTSIDDSFAGEKDFVDIAYKYLFHSFKDREAPKKEYIRLPKTSTGEIETILNRIYVEYTNQEFGYLQMIRAELIRLLILVFRIYRSDKNQTHNINAYKRLIVQNAVDYMQQNYNKNILCEELASRVYISSSYFSRVFKEIQGKSVIQTLQQIRIEKACALLEKTVHTVDEVADQVGYSDIKHFYKVFLKEKGRTPGKYRQEMRRQECPPEKVISPRDFIPNCM